MTDKKEQQAQDDFQKTVEETRAKMALPVKDRPQFAVVDYDSGSAMLAGVFDSQEDADNAVARLLSRRDPSAHSEDNVFVAKLHEARSAYEKRRNKDSNKDSKK